MKKLFALLLFQSFLFIAFSQQKADSIAIVQLLKNDYKTLEKFDINKHIANCTTDYMLIEDGEVWTLQKEVEYFKANAIRQQTRKDNFTIYKFSSSGTTAYLVYHLKSDLSEKGKVTTKNWTESAVFKKSAGAWKIALIHSTTVAGKM